MVRSNLATCMTWCCVVFSQPIDSDTFLTELRVNGVCFDYILNEERKRNLFSQLYLIQPCGDYDLVYYEHYAWTVVGRRIYAKDTEIGGHFVICLFFFPACVVVILSSCCVVFYVVFSYNRQLLVALLWHEIWAKRKQEKRECVVKTKQKQQNVVNGQVNIIIRVKS